MQSAPPSKTYPTNTSSFDSINEPPPAYTPVSRLSEQGYQPNSMKSESVATSPKALEDQPAEITEHPGWFVWCTCCGEGCTYFGEFLVACCLCVTACGMCSS